MNRAEAQEFLLQYDRMSPNIEFIRAFANGQDIQMTTSKGWETYDTYSFTSDPSTYRIKPRPIEGWVNVYPDGKSAVFHSTRQRADDASVHGRTKCVFVREVEDK